MEVKPDSSQSECTGVARTTLLSWLCYKRHVGMVNSERDRKYEEDSENAPDCDRKN